MKRKIVWLLLSCLVVLSLLLASCAPAAPTTPTLPTAQLPPPPTTPITPTAPTAPTVPTVPTAEVPKYGGVFRHALDADQRGFDPFTVSRSSIFSSAQTTEALATGDWGKGPAGSNELDFFQFTPHSFAQMGGLAESWEFPDKETIIYHIRKGDHWSLNPKSEASRLLNGREATAEDVVYTFKRNFGLPPELLDSKSYHLARLTPDEYPISVTATDKYTVVVKVKAGFQGSLHKWLSQSTTIVAPEVVKKYGNLNDWKNDVGSGPFMLVDYVPSVSLTFVRNPNFWQKDPVGPGKGNQLPYLDGVKYLVIPDNSTRAAALRTAKIDHYWRASAEDAAQLEKSTPQLQKAAIVEAGRALAMRTDKPELPWYNIKVRQALQMAIDRETLVKDYYGEAEILGYPAVASRDYLSSGAFVPLEKLPASVQELFKYQPDKAKQLLAEAGYPNGFTMEIILESPQVDEATLLKDYLAKIGVNLQLSVKEHSVYVSIGTNRTHKEGYFKDSIAGTPFAFHEFRATDPGNESMVDDPKINNELIPKFMEWYQIDDAKSAPILGQYTSYILEQAWYLALPSPYTYTMWWPWVKNFHGEWSIGAANRFGFARYIWIDQALKKSLGY